MLILRVIMLCIGTVLLAFIAFILWLMQVQPLDNPIWDFLALVPMTSCAVACFLFSNGWSK